jgi:ATP-dependent protease ClpP protease subunit
MEIDKKIEGPLLHRILEEVSKAEQEAGRAQGALKEEIVLGRQRLFKEIEGDPPKRKLVVYVSSFASNINISDIAPLGSMLDTIGKVDNLDFLIHSPGGSGVVAEKIVDMLWQHCNKELRIIVPNMAKSAATLIALGGTKIIMGYCSELGPIDPQTTILVGGVPQSISLQSFIEASEDIIEKLHTAKKRNEEHAGYLVQLSSSTLDPAFLMECQKQVAFAKDFVKVWTVKMLKAKNPEWSDEQILQKAKEIAEDLSSTNKRFTHGRMIGAHECSDLGLNVEELNQGDPYWRLIWELYVRAEVFLMINSSAERGAAKLFIDSNSQLISF